MTTFAVDRADSGEIPRATDPDAETQIIRPDLLGYPSFEAIPRKVIDLDDTVTFIPETIGIVPDPACATETARLTILGSLADAYITLDGELEGPQPTEPPKLPPIPVPSKGRSVPLAAMVDRAPASLPARLRYRGSRRRVVRRRVSPWWGVAVAVLCGLAAYAGLALAALAVVR